jgi:hypothetical protein
MLDNSQSHLFSYLIEEMFWSWQAVKLPSEHDLKLLLLVNFWVSFFFANSGAFTLLQLLGSMAKKKENLGLVMVVIFIMFDDVI